MHPNTKSLKINNNVIKPQVSKDSSSRSFHFKMCEPLLQVNTSEMTISMWFAFAQLAKDFVQETERIEVFLE